MSNKSGAGYPCHVDELGRCITARARDGWTMTSVGRMGGDDWSAEQTCVAVAVHKANFSQACNLT